MMSALPKATFLFALLFFLISVNNVWSQDDYRIHRISVNDGLSQGDVRCMIQDHNGFLWLGTRDGLNRYDGDKFSNYLPDIDDSASLAFNQITALALDAHNHLWIGTTDGISLYHPETDCFSNFPFDTNTEAFTEVQHIFGNGTSLILSTNNGLITFDTEKRSFERSPRHSKFRGEFISQFHTSEQFGTWVATSKGVHYKGSTESVWRLLLRDHIIEDILFDEKGVFISTDLGLFKFDSTGTTPRKIPLPLNTQETFQVIRSVSGALWIAANQVVVLDPKDDRTVKTILSHERERPYTLSEDRVRALYETRDETIWMGTFGYGLNKFNPGASHFAYLGDRGQFKLSSNYISGIYTKNDVEIFIGTTRGLNVVNLDQNKHEVLLNEGEMNLIYKLEGDKSGTLWISSSNGLYRYKDRNFGKLNFPAWVVSDIDELNDSTLLLTTQLNGIFLFNKEDSKSSLLIPPRGLLRTTYAALPFQDEIWIGSEDGLRIFSQDGSLKKHFRSGSPTAGSLPVDVVKTICEDRFHQIWIGTWGGGLSLFNPADSTFKTYDRRDGLPNNVVYGILEDDIGNLWLSTNAGISVFDHNKEEFRNFDYQDGLQGDEFNTNAYFRSVNGKMYFGGIDGLSFFEPEKVTPPVESRTVRIINVTINDREFPLDAVKNQNTIETDWRSDNIGVEFTSIDFRRPDKIQFQYSVNNESWFSLSSRRNLELVDLSPGRHVVRFRANAEGGTWSEASAMLTIIVRPPLWRDPFVLAAAAAGLLILIYAGHRARIRFLKNINASLNNLVVERTREIQGKNEEIQAQNEELTSSSELMAEKNLLLEKQGQELLELSNALERKVEERTRHIQLLNEELTEQNIQLEQFSFIAAHNFRGPLARIRGLIDLIKRSTNRDELSQLIAYIENSSNELDQVIGDMSKILNLSRDKGALFEEISLKAILDRTLMLLADDIRERDIRVDKTEFSALSVYGSPAYVQSVFYNLIENAIKYSNTTLNDRIIKITSFRQDAGVRVQVIDNGIGIDLKLVMNKMFRLYQRFNTHSSGRGLGLYLVKTQMEVMGGSVAVESTAGEGTIFTLDFKAV